MSTSSEIDQIELERYQERPGPPTTRSHDSNNPAMPRDVEASEIDQIKIGRYQELPGPPTTRSHDSNNPAMPIDVEASEIDQIEPERYQELPVPPTTRSHDRNNPAMPIDVEASEIDQIEPERYQERPGPSTTRSRDSNNPAMPIDVEASEIDQIEPERYQERPGPSTTRSRDSNNPAMPIDVEASTAHGTSDDVEPPTVSIRATKRPTLKKWFKRFNMVLTGVAIALFVLGFLVPANQGKDKKPLSMFYTVFGIFQHSAAKHDRYILLEDQGAFSAIGITYCIANFLSIFLIGCDYIAASALVKFLAGLLMQISVFVYAVLGDDTRSDIKWPLAVNFVSGMCATYGAVCMWAAKYQSDDQEGSKNGGGANDSNKIDTFVEFMQTWHSKADFASLVLLVVTISLTILTASVSGWNREPTMVWNVAYQNGTTKVFSTIVIVSFTLSLVAVLLKIGAGIILCLFDEWPKKASAWISRTFKILILVAGISYIFGILAFTSDMYKQVDDDLLVPGPAFSLGWVIALFYIWIIGVQIVVFLKVKFKKQNEEDIVTYVAYVFEIFFFVGIFFVYIEQKDEPISMLYVVFGNSPCRSINRGAKTFLQVLVLAQFVLHVIYYLAIYIICVCFSKHNEAVKIVIAVLKLISAAILLICTIIYWSVHNLENIDVTMVMACLLGAVVASAVGSVAVIYQKWPDWFYFVDKVLALVQKLTNWMSKCPCFPCLPPDAHKHEDDCPMYREMKRIIASCFSHMSRCCCLKDAMICLMFFVALGFQVPGMFVSGWKLQQPVVLFSLQTVCHTLEGFRILAAISAAFLSFAIISLVGEVAYWCYKKDPWVFATKPLFLIGGFLFSFATGALLVNVLTGVDTETWSIDVPVVFSIIASLAHAFEILIEILNFFGKLSEEEKKEAPQTGYTDMDNEVET